jgi:hypothetical protein
MEQIKQHEEEIYHKENRINELELKIANSEDK